MERVKQAVLILVEKGKILLPNALEILRISDDPVRDARAVLKKFSDQQKISKEEFLLVNQTITRKFPSEKENNIFEIHTVKTFHTKGRVQRRFGGASERMSQSIQQIAGSHQNRFKTSNIINRPTSIPADKHIIHTSLDDLDGLVNYENDLITIQNYDPTYLTSSINDMLGYFQNRFNKLARIFRGRVDLVNLTLIKDISRTEKQVSVIGMVAEKKFYSGAGGFLILEDPSTEKTLHVIIPKSNKTLMEECMHILNDTVICASGILRQEKLIADEILLPDLPTLREKRRAKVPVHVAYLSDIHVGSKKFLEDSFNKFIKFLKGEYGNKKLQALGKQTRYIVFGGDVVDGVGIYPNQIDDLEITSIRDQYVEFARFIEQIPEDREIVIIPGNHDMVRSAEPQPRILPEYSPDLDNMSNVHMLSNPSQIAIHNIQMLLYHCTSLPDIMNNIPGMSINKPVEVMKQMLKARHLAPLWGAKTPLATEKTDHLVIDPIPDVFHGGHVHINGEGVYRGVHIVNSGTMQTQTSFQKAMNIDPTPGQIALLNLKSFQWNRLIFM